MLSMCPVCNGFTALVAPCPQCGAKAVDDGRFNDFFGPYSPYRPIEDVALTNGIQDVSNNKCAHLLHCPQCGTGFHHLVAEWGGGY